MPSDQSCPGWVELPPANQFYADSGAPIPPEPTPFDDFEMPAQLKERIVESVVADQQLARVISREPVLMLLEEILAELRRGNSIERTGAVSSAEIKFLANGTPQPTVKAFAGSVVPVDQALEAYGRLFREANARAMNGWVETVAGLEQKESAS